MKIEVISKSTICSNEDSIHNYFAWPSVTRLKNGRLAMAASGFRTGHVDPFGKSVICFSEDEGKTWSLPAPVIDTPLDDRDGGIVAFGKSSVMVTSFNIAPERLRKYNTEWDVRHRSDANKKYWDTYLDLAEEVGGWEPYYGHTYRMSHDNGVTWGKVGVLPMSSPHGAAELPDGNLLYVGRQWDKEKLGSYIVYPDGSYEFLCEIEQPEGVDGQEGVTALRMLEPHAIVLEGGRVIVHMRSYPDASFTIYQCESEDYGRSFSRPHRLLPQRGGSPAHIVEDNGTLISVYGYRDKPYGIRAMFSKDKGKTWNIANVIVENEPGGDVGYPSSVALQDGSILTVYYGREDNGRGCVIKQVIWRYSEDEI